MTRTKACRSAYPYTRRRARPPRSPRRALNDDEGPHYDPSGDVFGRITADLEAGQEEEWQDDPFFNAHLYYVPNEPLRWLAAQSGVAGYKLTEGSGT